MRLADAKNELQRSGEPRSGGKAFVRRLCKWRGVNSNVTGGRLRSSAEASKDGFGRKFFGTVATV